MAGGGGIGPAWQESQLLQWAVHILMECILATVNVQLLNRVIFEAGNFDISCCSGLRYTYCGSIKSVKV